MQLADDVFDRVVQRLGDSAGERSGGQRRGPRVVLRGRLTILPCPEGLDGPVGPPLSVPMRDLSLGGTRFLLPRRLPLETQFILMLPHGETRDGGPLALLGSVTHWQPVARDLFAIGGQFQESLDTSTLPSEMFAYEPRIVLPGLAGNEPEGIAAAEMFRRAAC